MPWPRAWAPAALLFALLFAPAAAGAHATLVETQPRDGERLGQAPGELVLRFSEPVVPVAVRLLDARGAGIAGVTVEPRGETLVVRPPGTLAEGAYLLSYRVTSVDAHPVGATLRFGVGVDPAAGGAESDVEASSRWAGFVARWLVYLTALGAAGQALFLLLLRPPEPVAARTRRWVGRLALAGIAAAVLRLGVAGLELAGLPPAGLASAAPWTAAAGTTLASATAVAVLGLAILAAGSGRRWAGLAGALLVGLSFTLTGHAATAQPRWLTGPALLLHTLCGAFWLASLVPLWWGLRLPPAAAHALLRRFSAVALVLVGLLALAGGTLAWVQLGGDVAAAWRTAYGWRLIGKLSLVAGLVAVAALNRIRLTPALATAAPGAAGSLRRSLAVDLALGLGVLAVTASFPFSPPPRALQATPPAEEGIAVVASAPGGGQATLTLLPGRVGANRLQAWVTDPDGAPLAAREASLRWSLPEAGLEPARVAAALPAPGVVLAEGVTLARAGRWNLRLSLLVDDFTKLTIEATVDVR